MPPTIAQQRGVAYAVIPFAVLSCLSSGHVICHLLCRERQKLRRMYQRLILGMNWGVLILSSTYAWGAVSVPDGTPHFAGAAGNEWSCTANGFLFTALSLTVPAYYGSLSIAAYMGIANQFEEKYRWVETPIHLVAWCVPLALFMYPAFTGGFNPNGAGCALAQAPPGCDADPLVPCERGNDIGNFRLIVGLGLVLLYFVFPPSIMGATYFWLKKTRKKLEASQETDQSRVHARNQIMQQVANQIYLYLFSFWSTIVPTLVSVGQQILMGEILYSLLIISNCIYALQGFVMAIVYFTLENRGTPVDSLPSPRVEDGHNSARDVRHSEATPPKCQQPEQNIPPDADSVGDAAAPTPPPEDPRAASDDAGAAAAATARLHFNIFDVEEDGPWAEFFREEEEDELPPELPPQLRWRPEEGDADKNLDLRTKLYLYENVLRI